MNKLNQIFSTIYIAIGLLIIVSILLDFNLNWLINIVGISGVVSILLARFKFDISQNKISSKLIDLFFLAAMIWYSFQNEVLWGPILVILLDLFLIFYKSDINDPE